LAPDAEDSSTPSVVFTNPSVSARSVPTYSLVSVTFGEAMDPSTISGSSFYVRQGGEPLTGSTSYIAASKVAVYHPSAPLEPDRTYTATVTTGVRNLSGVALAEDVVWTFTTTDGRSPFGDGMRLYFGDLHTHSAYSDGQGTPTDAFATARANGLDFFALADHSSMLTDEEWRDTLDQANAATVDGAFVGLRGFEFTHPNGHINVYDTEAYVWEGDPKYDTFGKFYAWLANQPTAIGQFNHPIKAGSKDWNFDDFAYHAAADEKLQLRETFVFPPNQFLLGLDQGWRIGAVSNSDTHRADWGRLRRTGLVAPGLTQDGVLEALRARRTFSTHDRSFAVLMQANGSWMGSVISNTATISFAVSAYNPDPANRILSLTVYDNGVPVTETMPLAYSAWFTWTPSIAGRPNHYYYVKAQHAVGNRSLPAFTSPVWTDTSETPSLNTFLPLVVRGSP
jgi:hypothetical protein